jgi:hypothetical protein
VAWQPPRCHYTAQWGSVASVTYERTGAYYDLTVPDAGHYLAEGVWHHNTGKTYGLLDFFHCLCRDNDGLRVLFCRATRAALTESVLVTYEQEILPLDGMEAIAEGARRDQRRAYRYPETGSEIVLGGLDKATRILSTAWDFVFVNEAIETTVDFWEAIASRMSRPGRDARFGYLIGDTNPGHPSHWLKLRCDAGTTTLWETRHEANPAMYHRGRGAWTPAGRRYLAQLDTLTGTRRKRLRDGLWATGEGLWFEAFDPDVHVHEDAEFEPALPAYLAVDPGVFTGAVWFQWREIDGEPVVTVFADYLSEGLTAAQNARRLLDATAERCGAAELAGRYCDPAGGARNPVGPTVIRAYADAGLPLAPWAKANPSVGDSLSFLEDLIQPIGGPPRLYLHPRCRRLVDAFATYKRAKRNDQWMDYPADPQHPAEDLIDALRGGCHARRRRVARIYQ